MEYTLKDLEEARQELANWQERFANDGSNNPNKYSSQIRDAASKVRHITEVLKEAGALPKTPEEELTAKLDELHPNARSRSVVTHKGKKYQIRYFPLDVSRSGKTVHEWGHEWILFDGNRK